MRYKSLGLSMHLNQPGMGLKEQELSLPQTLMLMQRLKMFLWIQPMYLTACTILQEDIQRQVRQLEKLQQEIEKDIVKKKTQDDSQLIKAVALYSKMDAGIAAQSLALLERKIAVKILKQMKEKQASLILSNMGADESASMIEEITRK